MRKNGFTLIELLAIIVILAIVAVITVPLVLNIVENSKMKAAKVSGYGYKDAINKYYLLNSIESSGYFIPDGDYSVDGQTGYLVGNGLTLELNFSGKSPDSGTVEMFDSEIKQACLQFGDYAVKLADDELIEVIKGSCSELFNPQPIYIYAYKGDTETKDIEDMIIGDYVVIGEDSFYVVNPNSNGNVVLLSEYNLKYFDEDIRQYKVDDGNYFKPLEYVNSYYYGEYWIVPVEKTVVVPIATSTATATATATSHSVTQTEWVIDTENYPVDSYGYSYIYRTINGEETPNDIYGHVLSYKEYLKVMVPTIVDARLLSYEEAADLGCSEQEFSCPSWMSFGDWQHYALGTLASKANFWLVYANYDNLKTTPYYYSSAIYRSGIRPVIEIPRSSF